MKKLIVPLSVLAVGIGGYFVLESSMAKPIATSLKEFPHTMELPKGIDSAYVAKLNEFGFGNTQSAREYRYILARQKWQKNFGLTFIGEQEMSNFLEDNGFIIGASDKFLESIPAEAGREMMDNYNKIKDCLFRYNALWTSVAGTGTLVFGDNLNLSVDWPIEPPPPRIAHTIYVIANAKKFNTEGMVVKEGKLINHDPIAVVKTDGGYVEIAHW